jgi:hypothetical protein
MDYCDFFKNKFGNSYMNQYENLLPKANSFHGSFLGKLSETSLSQDQYFQRVSEVMFSINLINCGFEVENDAKISTNGTDIDIKANRNSTVFNIEIKTPDQTIQDDDTLYGHKGLFRYSNDKNASLNLIIDDYEHIKKEFLNAGAKVSDAKLNDNKLKDYLVSAQNKFNYPSTNEVNVLIICVSTQNLNYFLNYISNPYTGLFSNTPYIDKVLYDKVDFIVLSNSIEGHLDDKFNFNVWDTNNYIHLFIPNRHSYLANSIDSNSALQLLTHFKDTYAELAEYSCDKKVQQKFMDNGIYDAFHELLFLDFIAEKHPMFCLNLKQRVY